MIKIKDFTEKGFRVSWTLLNMGFNGNQLFSNQLGAKDIIDYAISKMEGGEESYEVILLASLNAANTGEIKKLLNKLSESEVEDYDIEYRKWIVTYVVKHLPSNQDDFIQGLITLGDIWAALDFPDDSPHVFQGRSNVITPNEYYTQENYIQLLESHNKWIVKEIARINSQ